MDAQTQEIQNKIQAELQNYLHSRFNFKEYIQSMKEVSAWLAEKATK